ncbi:MAG: hypothetical protein H6826_15115 [Planctomycetes bacterium]|nr:hypothetical protein [Planctomycetota bacterium]
MKRRDRVVAALVVLGLGAWAISYAWTQMGLSGGCTVAVRNVGSASLSGVAIRLVGETDTESQDPWNELPLLASGASGQCELEPTRDSHLEVRWVDATGAHAHWRLPVYITGAHYRAVQVDVADGRAPSARYKTRPRGAWGEVGPIVSVADRDASQAAR